MDGVLIINKPAGLTSHDVVARVRRILGERRIGHTGTLDPFATGVLVLMIGRATRLVQFLGDNEKEYEATIRFGYATDTGDLTGTPLSSVAGRNLLNTEIETAIASLRGEIDQVPPMYSAKKHHGRRLYELARAGEEVERKPVRVTIYEFETISALEGPLTSNEDGTVDVNVRVVCSAGTYVRTLAEDVGQRLNLGAHLTSLKRTRAGDFRLADSLSLDQLQDRFEANSTALPLLSLDAALSRLPFLHLTAAEAERARHGLKILLDQTLSANWLSGTNIRMCADNNSLIAVGLFDSATRTLHPRVVLV